MYIEVIAGLDPEKELNEQDQVKLEQTKVELFKEFLTRYYNHNNNIDTAEYVRKDHEGDILRYELNRNQDQFREYFMSDLEFGAIRKDENDTRADSNWKTFMMAKLFKTNFSLVKNYFDDWNKMYAKHVGQRYLQDAETKRLLALGSELLDENYKYADFWIDPNFEEENELGDNI